MTRTRSLRGQIWGTALVVVVAAGSSLVGGSVPASAAACPLGVAGSCTATQSVTATISAGAISLTAPTTLVISSTAPGTSTGALPLGSLTIQDTLNDATAMSVVVAPTDLALGGGPCPAARSGVLATLWNAWSFSTASTIFANDAGFPGTAGTPTKGAGGTPTLTGSDSPLGCGYPTTGITLATTPASNVNEGAWDMTGTTVSLNISGQAVAGAYTATLQYTITG